MKDAKARRLADQIVNARLDNAKRYGGIGHSVFTTDAVKELVADVLTGKAKP